MLKILKIILVLLMPAYLCAAFIYCDTERKNSRCIGLDILMPDSSDGNFISTKEVKDLIIKSGLNPEEKRIASIKEEAIERSINKNPIIKNVECYITPSGIAKVEIFQRKPIIRIITPDTSYYIDKDCKRMPISKNVVTYIPVATGYISEEYAKKKLFPLALYILSNKKWEAQIEQIYINPSQEIEMIPRIGDHLIFFGKISNFERKFNMLDELYLQSFAKTGWDTYNKINLSYNGRIICTKRPSE